MKLKLRLIGIVGFLFLGSQLAFADTAAVSFTSFPGTSNLSLNVGWAFATSTALDLTALGYYDLNGNGLASAHTVGIFSWQGVLLTSVVVPAGTGSSLIGGFRYSSIGSFHLNPGQYFLMANNPATDPYVSLANGFSHDPRLTYVTGVYSFGGATLQPPTTTSTQFDPSIFGPNFLIASPVPEPVSLILLSTGLIGLAAARFGKNRARRQ